MNERKNYLKIMNLNEFNLIICNDLLCVVTEFVANGCLWDQFKKQKGMNRKQKGMNWENTKK